MRPRNFLPMNRQDMEERKWDELDFLVVTGDAYVDHPSFGAAIISRLLEKEGYRVGILAQPDWKKPDAFLTMGRPRLACLITGGNLDSMVNHYTAARKRRSKDAYSPGGKTGLRPDLATVVYSNQVRAAMPGVPVIIGGLEASLRRFAHYDYWSDKVRRSILLDSQADLMIYGMGEKAISKVAKRLAEGAVPAELTEIRGTVIPWKGTVPEEVLSLPSYEEVKDNKKQYAQAFWEQYKGQDPYRGAALYQPHGREGVIQYPPEYPLTQGEMDGIYALPYVGTYHPQYEDEGGVPAIEEVEFSITSVRGCYGSCSFCALTFHQGRIVQGRSAESIVREAERLTWSPHFKGYIHDVGGPTANFRRPACAKQTKVGACPHKQCLYPEPCREADLDHGEYMELLRRLRKLPKVKKVFVRSGIRYDAVMADRKHDFLRELCQYHVSGQLKVAPEHVSNEVLKRMGKPAKGVYNQFVQRFKKTNEELGMKQYLVPYLMSSHPGSTMKEAVELAEYVRDMGVNPEQVQDFIPTPGTLSTCMYFTGLDPRTMEKVYVPRSAHEKALQRALIQYRNPKNYHLVKEALLKAGREDLIGFGPKCLIRPHAPSDRGEQHVDRRIQHGSGKKKEAGETRAGLKATPESRSVKKRKSGGKSSSLESVGPRSSRSGTEKSKSAEFKGNGSKGRSLKGNGASKNGKRKPKK